MREFYCRSLSGALNRSSLQATPFQSAAPSPCPHWQAARFALQPRPARAPHAGAAASTPCPIAPDRGSCRLNTIDVDHVEVGAPPLNPDAQAEQVAIPAADVQPPITAIIDAQDWLMSIGEQQAGQIMGCPAWHCGRIWKRGSGTIGTLGTKDLLADSDGGGITTSIWATTSHADNTMSGGTIWRPGK